MEKISKLIPFSRILIFLLPTLSWIVISFLKNIEFYKAGLLNPNFQVIEQCYYFNLIMLPIIVIFIGLLYISLIYIFRRSYKKLFFLFLIHIFLGASLFSLRYYITIIEPQKLVLKKEILYADKLNKSLKIIHFSDIQSAGIGDYEGKIFKKIRDLNPDLVLYTGDFLQLQKGKDFEEEWRKLHDLFKTLTPRLGIYAVYGDTELELYSKSPKEVLPLRLLSTRSEEFSFEGGEISIYGLNLFNSKSPQWASRGIETWLSKTSDKTFKIVLGHAPDYALNLKDSPIDLCLAGHTHGGQVKLPFLGPLIIDSSVPKNWAQGFRKIGVPYLNVSAGAGSNRYDGLPPIRFNCPTEITLINIIPIE